MLKAWILVNIDNTAKIKLKINQTYLASFSVGQHTMEQISPHVVHGPLGQKLLGAAS